MACRSCCYKQLAHLTMLILALGCGRGGENGDLEGEITSNVAAEREITPPSLQNSLQQAWILRDELEAWPQSGALGFDNERWLPTEYTPHLWRHLNAYLLDLDLQSRGGTAFRKDELEGKVDRCRRGLENLRDGQRAKDAPAPIPKLIGAKLAFHQPGNEARNGFRYRSADLKRVGDFVRYYHRLLYRVHDFVRWHAQASGLIQEESLYSELAAILNHLSDFQTNLRALTGKRLSDSSALQLEVQCRRLKDSHEKLERLLEQAVAAAVSDPDPLQAQVILGAPLLSAVQRAAVHSAISSATARSRSVRRSTDDEQFPSPELRQSHVDRCRRQLELERKLLVLTGSFTDEELGQLEDLEQRLTQAGAADVWESVQAAGRQLADLWAKLPERIIAVDADHRSLPQPGLAFVDPRADDALDSIPETGKWLFPQLDILPALKKLQVTAPGETLQVADDQWQPLTLDVVLPDETDERVDVTVQFAQAAVEMKARDKTGLLVPGQSQKVRVSSQGTLEYEVRALPRDGDIQRDNEIIFTVSYPGQEPATANVVYRLPKPDRIELVVERLDYAGQAQPALPVGNGAFRLEPFPNRQTQFRFQLRNLSERDKVVDVACFAVKRPPNATFSPGRLLQDEETLLPDIAQELRRAESAGRAWPGETIAVANELSLSADGSAKMIPFGAGKDPEAGEAGDGSSGDTTGSTDAKPAAEAASGIDVSNGIVCVVREGEKDREWKWWLELDCLRPNEYLKVSSTYSATEQKVSVVIEPRAKTVLPGSLADQPITVDWVTQQAEQRWLVNQTFQGTLTDQAAVELWAEVADDQLPAIDIRLDADGYPRAFLHRLGIGDDQRRVARNIEIESVSMGKYVYLTSRDAPPPKLEEGHELRYVEDNAAAFDATQNDDLIVKLMVDYPDNAFVLAGQDDVVELEWRGQQHSFFSDRDVRVSLLGVSQDGLLTLFTKVKDHSWSFSTAGERGADPIKMRGRYDGEDLQPPDDVRIILDREPPRVSSFRAVTPKVEVGKPIRAVLRVQDDSGIEKIKFALTKRASDAVPDDAASKDTDLPRGGDDMEQVALTLPTAEVAPGKYWLQCLVVDRVGHATRTAAGAATFGPQPIEIVPVKVEPVVEKPQPEIKGVLKGYVFKGRRSFRPSRITVELEAISPPRDAMKTGGDGRFSFPDVPAGEYVLKAAGAVQNTIRSGELKVKIEKQADFDIDWAIELK